MSETMLMHLAQADFTLPIGAVHAVRSDWIEATGPAARVGDFCHVASMPGTGERGVVAEVVAISSVGLRLVPLGPVASIACGAKVTLAEHGPTQPSLSALSRRAVDALGRPIDGLGDIPPDRRTSLAPTRLSPLQRTMPGKRLECGVRAIDGLLPLAQGQKIGIFAPSGAGKSSLLEQLCVQTHCDRVIFCQIGERGREVEKAWRLLGARSQDRPYTLIAAAADESPSMRVRALDLAIALAEQGRVEGEHVLLLIDSVTRVAMALRELGVAAGEPPSARGYTPNVFSTLPRQLERCGAVKSGGAITAILSVLSETEDVDDPIVELMKSILDGHIVLSRSLAEQRQFPAIDLARSVSRLADDVSTPVQTAEMARIFRLHGTYEDARSMIESGIYVPGSNAAIDASIAARPDIEAFLRQGRDENSILGDTLGRLQALGVRHGR